jgi:hypothetical protein
MVTYAREQHSTMVSELVVAGFALVVLLAAQWMLSTAIQGTNYYGVDGKMAQATVLTSLNFSVPFNVTSINPIQGIGSQLLPKNAWGNPAFWPFAVLDKEAATDVSALVALACFVIGSYIMARCFDVPVLPSAVAAQLSIFLFAPALLIVYMPTNFCLTPGDAVVYAPYMIALGLLGRLEPGSWRIFGLTAAGIFVLVLYSLYCDPLWTLVAGIAWAVPFAVITINSFHRQTIIARCAALACCFGLLLLSGAMAYLYTLSQYTARVQFAHTLDRDRLPVYVSALTYSPNMKYFYLACGLGWLLGFVTVRGKPRILVLAATLGFASYVLYTVIYLLVNTVWVLPIPIYLEQCLLPLYIAGAVAGYWGALRSATSLCYQGVQRLLLHLSSQPRLLIIQQPQGPCRGRFLTMTSALIIVTIIPAAVADYALNKAQPKAEIFYEPWPNEPELAQFFSKTVSLKGGRPFRGSVNFLTVDHDAGFTLASAWTQSIPAANEYSQLVTAQALYFLHKLLDKDVRGSLNHFQPFWANGSYSAVYWNALQMLGVRFVIERWPLPDELNQGFPVITLPHRPHSPDRPPGTWYIYELPHPNVGNYSPTETLTDASAAEIMSAIRQPHFDFTKQAVVSTTIDDRLVPARDMRLSIIRGGLHVSGHSDGTSLVVLPQQFSHCLRAHDSRVRLVRVNLMLTGVIFSGDVDTDILFDYGIFTPYCRLADLADGKRLELKIDLRMAHLQGDRLFPDWNGVWTRLRAAADAIR